MPVAFEDLGTGGPIIALLALLSLLSWTLIVAKTVQLWSCRSGQARRTAAIDAWSDGDTSGALAQLERGTSPADRITARAMQALGKGIAPQALDADLTRRGNEELARLGSGLRLLELIAMVSPLLGLLGTVLGMIQSFQELELAEGAANASVLAGGIWQALLTTAAGLMVAIPAAVAAGLFAVRIDGAAQSIESAVGDLMLTDSQSAIRT